MKSELISQSHDDQTPSGREIVKFQYLSELEATDDRSALVQLLGAGQLGVNDLVQVCFSDGSLIRKYGRAFSTCSVFFGSNDPLNIAVSLPEVRSSFMSEVQGCKVIYSLQSHKFGGGEGGVQFSRERHVCSLECWWGERRSLITTRLTCYRIGR